MPFDREIRSAEPSLRLPVEAEETVFSVRGMGDEGHAILHDYDGDLPAFLNDCTSECSGCGRRWFTGYGCAQAEFDDWGRFTCAPCERRLESLKAGSIHDDARALDVRAA